MLIHIIKREYMMLVRSKAQIIGTLFLIVLFLAAGIVGKIFINSAAAKAESGAGAASPHAVIGIAPEMQEYQAAFTADTVFASQILPSGTAPATWLREEIKQAEGSVFALGGTPESPRVYQYENGSQNEYLVEQIKQRLSGTQISQLSLDTAAQERLFANANPAIEIVKENEGTKAEDNPVGYIRLIGVTILLLMSIITGLSTIASGVVEEKQSRIVEILLSSIPPRRLLLGKILGIGSFVLTQILLYALTILVSLKIAGMLGMVPIGSILFSLFLWSTIGFLVFTSLSGGLAATVSRQEDLPAVVSPLTFSAIIPFYVGMFLVPARPEWIVTKILSYIPGFSSFLIPARQAYGGISTWEIALAAGLGIISIPLLASLAGKIYERSILHTGKRVKITEVLRAS